MATAKPVVLTKVASLAAGSADPKPLVVVGPIPFGTITPVPASFADLAAVRTYLATLVGQLQA